MNQLAVVLITALGTGSISMSAIWIGGRLTRANEDRKWRRDHALEAYSEFIRLVDATTREANNAYLLECGTEEHAKQGVKVVEQLSELYRTANRIILLASQELQAPFSALSRYTPEAAGKLVQCPKATEVEAKAAREKLADLSASFLMQARNDLGIHPSRQVRDQIPNRPRRYLATTLAICIALTIVTAGLIAYVLNSRKTVPNGETALVDLPALPRAVSWDLIWGLNAKPVVIPAVVTGETPLELTAIPSKDSAAENRHAVALRFSDLNPGGVYRVTVWVKSAGTNIQLQAHDGADPQTKKPPDEGEVRLNLETGSTTVAYGNLLAEGIDTTTDGWNKAWVDLKSTNGQVYVYLGLIEKGGSHVFTGSGEQLLLGGITVTQTP
jgi:hypothetical protein